jgi:hypothetical protein
LKSQKLLSHSSLLLQGVPVARFASHRLVVKLQYVPASKQRLDDEHIPPMLGPCLHMPGDVMKLHG